MSRFAALTLAAFLSASVAGFVVARRQSSRHAAELAGQRALAEVERAELEAALAAARKQSRPVVATPTAPVVVTEVAARPTPAQIIAKLRELRAAPGPLASRTVRQAVYWLEELAAAGPIALPAIHEFLTRSEDMDLDTAWFTQGRNGARGRLPNDFLVPPSLRFGLFDVLRQIGGPEAELVLSDAMSSTGRGVELAYLTRLLQEMSPNQYREKVLLVAHDLLAASAGFVSANPLDRDHRDYLFGVLTQFGDASYATSAQSQLVRDDGKIDLSSLRYLQQSLGSQAVQIAAQTYLDPRLVDPAVKEPLVRVALTYVGSDPQANQFYQQAINDPALPKDARRNLIEDLNQDGFVDRKNLTANDLPFIQSRIALIEQSAPSAMDPINAKAFAEAYKDLQNMQGRILNPPQTPPGSRKKTP